MSRVFGAGTLGREHKVWVKIKAVGPWSPRIMVHKPGGAPEPPVHFIKIWIPVPFPGPVKSKSYRFELGTCVCVCIILIGSQEWEPPSERPPSLYFLLLVPHFGGGEWLSNALQYRCVIIHLTGTLSWTFNYSCLLLLEIAIVDLLVVHICEYIHGINTHKWNRSGKGRIYICEFVFYVFYSVEIGLLNPQVLNS